MAIFMLPHCDLHVAMSGTPPLRLRVINSIPDPNDHTRYVLHDVTAGCKFDFFAPYKSVGTRRLLLPSVNPATGLVDTFLSLPGIYLFNVQVNPEVYLVGRLQVHGEICDWWFGNSSITTAKDGGVAHAQPSIYAEFGPDPTGTDLVGDITGHGYVTLESMTEALFTSTADGRLLGKQEGTGTLKGSFLNVDRMLPVHVVDYAKPRRILDQVRISGLPDLSERCNLLFLSEGFRAQDRPRFDAMVTQIVDGLFNKPRHAPFDLIKHRFNVWKAFEPSHEQSVTYGFRVNDRTAPAVKLGVGFPIPYGDNVSPRGNTYAVQELVARVGLPLRTEPATTTRAQLIARWTSQSLDFDPGRVDDGLVATWKAQTSLGILEARDTAFGMMIGSRPVERDGGATAGGPIPAPADQANDPNLRPFIKRVYEWFIPAPVTLIAPDPRRHARERFATSGAPNLGLSMMRYIAGLQERGLPHRNIGREWVPDSLATFSPSRGLVVLLTQDAADAGTSVNAQMIAISTLGLHRRIPFDYFPDGPLALPVMRRVPPELLRTPTDPAVDIIAHELGHSFNLGDEYETFPNNDPNATRAALQDLTLDNVTRLGAIFLKGTIQPNGHVVFQTDEINPDQVKWLKMPRIAVSDTLIRDSETSARDIKVTIDRRNIGSWVAVKKRASDPVAFLRVRDFAARNGVQLPFILDNAHNLDALRISHVDEAAGTLLLRAHAALPSPFPVFPKGSQLYLPQFDSLDRVRMVVETPVLDWLKTTHRPLNRDTDVTKVNSLDETPVDIQGFEPPPYAFRVIGIYEGADHHAGRRFRPAGGCKMRNPQSPGTAGEYCYVCKYLIVHRVAPDAHPDLDLLYYPAGKVR